MALQDGSASTPEHETLIAALDTSTDQLPAHTTRSESEVHADLKAGVRAHTKRKKVVEGKQNETATPGASQRVVHGTEESHVDRQPNGEDVFNEEDHNQEGEGEDEDEEDLIDVEAPLPRKRKVGEDRRRQNAIFESYVQAQARKTPANLPVGEDEDQTISTLVRQFGAPQIISSPREYQLELYERAIKENIIAVLDTGSGKTLIAVLLLKHILEQELDNRASGKPKRVAFFLVDSVALVFQQFDVLQCNLDSPMWRVCGDMDYDLSRKDFWQKQLSDNMVIVCTAAILETCLLRNYISMESINLLIFDEAHHAKKSHPYARIIKDFYAQVEETSQRPRVFGMTASPVDARVNVKKAALELEGLLHCRIATASDLSLMQHATRAKYDVVLPYNTLRMPYETALYRQLKPLLEPLKVFEKPLRWAGEASAELGPWCSDRVWQTTFSEDELLKLKAKTERNLRDARVVDFDNILAASLTQIEEASAIVKQHKLAEPRSSPDLLSSKVVELVEYLRGHFELPSRTRCIVFVKQRYTARLLCDLLARENIGTPHLRVGTLMGTRSGQAGDVNVSFKQQMVTLSRFKKGLVNCLFATSVAEEGIDIPDCNLVIRFDLYDTVIQCIQSRGRARQANSRYIHMVEAGNAQHVSIIREVKKSEEILRNFCNALPEDRLLTGNNFDMEYFLAKERTKRVYIDAKSKAKLTYRSSLVVLASFASTLPPSDESSSGPEYFVSLQGGKFVGEVRLPSTSPVAGAVGRMYSTKQVAKCSAAFEACLLLRKGKYLDEIFNSTFQKQLPAMRNAALAVSEKKKAEYGLRRKPAMWKVDSVPEQLYLAIITLDNPGVLGRPSQPLGMLTRAPLPDSPPCQLYFAGKTFTNACLSSVEDVLNVDEATLTKINKFTLRIFDDVFSKLYEAHIAHMPYFLVPIKALSEGTSKNPCDMIDWGTIELSQREWLEHNDDTPDEFFEDRFIMDWFDRSRKLWSVKVAPQYKPLDPVPPNTAPRTGTRKHNDNIMEYSISLWAKSRKNATFKENQRVFEAEYISLRRNLLDPYDIDNTKTPLPTKCYIIMEPLRISVLPTTVVAMAYNFPAIVHRLESHLIAMDACSMLRIPEVNAKLALEALTKDADNSEEHGELQVQLQRGMGRTYERLEFIGDSFLKMATTISLYTIHPDNSEYKYHVQRMVLICNLNLLNNALNLKLEEYIRSRSFNRRGWYPEGLTLLRGKAPAAPDKQALGDKTIADVCEALIGAALLTHRDTGDMDLAVRAVTTLVRSTDHSQESFSDYYKLYQKPVYQTSTASAAQLEMARQVEEQDAYHFRYPRLLRSAFTHSSYPFSYEHIPNYQRLEFLGDALLDMASISYIFHKFPERDPQWLTEHKMAMVSNQFLGALCVSLDFHRHIMSFSAVVRKQIYDYVTDIQECRREAERDAIRAGKRAQDCSRDYWLNAKAPPKCLPDMVEAYVGAIFVDSEYDYSQVERFFEEHVLWFFEDMCLYDTFANKHPTTFLAKLLDLSMGCSQWRLYAKEMPLIPGSGQAPRIVAGVMIHNEIIVDAEAKSSRYAKLAASKAALLKLEGLGRPEFRATYRCDCKQPDPEEQKDDNSPEEEEFVPATAI